MSASPGTVYWRVEGSLLDAGVVRPIAFFTINAQTFAGRWVRRTGVIAAALLFPFLYLVHRTAATRLLHALLRGVSRDRLDLLGEEYFHYELKPRLRSDGLARLREWLARGERVVLVSHGLEHIVRPLAAELGVPFVLSNRLEFRDGLATGRLLEPVLPPRFGLAGLLGPNSDGRLPRARLARELGVVGQPELLEPLLVSARRQAPRRSRPLVVFNGRRPAAPLSVRRALAGKRILLIGSTGFIGKVWLEMLLSDLPEIGKIYLLIRKQRAESARRRFERLVEESPVFGPLEERTGADFGRFLAERVEVVEGDVCRPDLGLDAETRARLAHELDLVVNSSGLTDFNPDLRQALASNVDATLYLLDFLRSCRHAALLHLSTCYVAGATDGRVPEALLPDYTPSGVPDFNAEEEWSALHRLIAETTERSQSLELGEELRQQVQARGRRAAASALEHEIARLRSRWLRNTLTEAGTRRARELGWPNTYTFTKSLAESLLLRRAADLPVAIVRPAIVETSIRQPFSGWNEGVNTSAPLSYLLGTFFRQLPSNERKCLDLIPVDLVARGMTLVAAALVERRHERLYQLATSAANPCDMRRSIELTSLAHRKYYRAQNGLENWLRAQFDAIPVSKRRYQTLSAPAQRALVRSLMQLPVPFVKVPLEKRERILARVEKLIEIYEPFILHHEHVFEADNVELLSAALPANERDPFGYDAMAVDWWEYWINIHVPALRRWVYPLLEGRPVETRPRRNHAVPVAAGSGTR